MSEEGVSFAKKPLGYKPSKPPLIVEIMEDSWITVTNESKAILAKVEEIESQKTSSPILKIFDFYESLWSLGLGLIIPAIIQGCYNKEYLNNINFGLLIAGIISFVIGIIVFACKISSLMKKNIPLTSSLAELKARTDSLRDQINIIQKRFHDQIQTTT